MPMMDDGWMVEGGRGKKEEWKNAGMQAMWYKCNMIENPWMQLPF
jgi:hypothetical protein